MANKNGQHLLHVKSNQIINGKPKLPTQEQIAYGEIAINYADGQEKLSILSSANAIKTISTDEQNENKFASQSALDSKQDTLISGTNIKTINGNSLLGEGNIEIQGGSGGGISDAPSDGSKYVRQDGNWVKETTIDTSSFATKTEISDMLTKTEASSTYQPIGDYLTAIPDEYITESELEGKGYLTSIPDDYVTDDKLNAKGYATISQLDSKQDKGDYALKSEIPDISELATKEELADKANTSELSNYVTNVNAEATYAKKSEIPEEYTLPIATAELLGGIKVGAGLSINSETGVLSATGGGTADSVDWSNITSKPEEFKPEAHQHVSSDITDLQDKLDTKADKTEISDMLTKTDASSAYQPIGDYLTAIPDEYVTESELEGKGYATQIWVNEQNFLTEHQDITNLATKQEVNDSLALKQDTLVSGTNIKTINGNSLLGEGNIEIQGGSTVNLAILTQQEYDELVEKDNNTIYFIKG